MDIQNTIIKHKANILLLGFTERLNIESIPEIEFTRCDHLEQMTELLIVNDYHLIISKFNLIDTNALAVNKSLESIKAYYANSKPKQFKFLVLTASEGEDQICKENQLLYFPQEMNIKSLILKLIDLPRETKTKETNQAIIDFEELFVRVDNNRKFVKEVIDKFFEIKDSRISDIKTPLLLGEYKKAKDAAHKLKGVLANFSMQEARNTIIELEQLILTENAKDSLAKLEELVQKIEDAKEFYLQNEALFDME